MSKRKFEQFDDASHTYTSRAPKHARSLQFVPAVGLTPKMRKQVKRLVTVGREEKFLDVSATYAQVDRGGTLTTMTNPAQGDTRSTRDGDALTQRRIRVAVDVYYETSAISTDVGHKIRILVFRWNWNTTPTLANIVENVGGIGDYRAICSPINYAAQQEGMITVLHDQTYPLNHANELCFRRMFLLKDHKQQFDSAASTGESQIYLLLVADDATGAHVPDIKAQYYSRFWFNDA